MSGKTRLRDKTQPKKYTVYMYSTLAAKPLRPDSAINAGMTAVIYGEETTGRILRLIPTYCRTLRLALKRTLKTPHRDDRGTGM